MRSRTIFRGHLMLPGWPGQPSPRWPPRRPAGPAPAAWGAPGSGAGARGRGQRETLAVPRETPLPWLRELPERRRCSAKGARPSRFLAGALPGFGRVSRSTHRQQSRTGAAQAEASCHSRSGNKRSYTQRSPKRPGLKCFGKTGTSKLDFLSFMCLVLQETCGAR